MRDLIFIQACPDDSYYIWQTQLWLESLKALGKSDKAVNLIFTPNYREFNKKWKILEALYPESEFFYHKDTDNLTKLLGIYISIPRPYMLMKYFELHPELKDKAIFYSDCDVLFTENFNIDKYIDDDVNYVSDTKSYISSEYFDSKVRDVLPDKLAEYSKRDILDETTKLVGISRQIAVDNRENSGGAQYLLKNIDADFWEKCITDCVRIKLHLQNVNKQFFENENKGFQSFCADMWAVLWGLWFRGNDVKIVPEMEFAWASDPISKIGKVGIYHNAGIVSNYMGDKPVFYKGTYHAGLNPFEDPHLEVVYNSEKSKSLSGWYYVSKLIELKQKYNY